ncbi:MAG: hypothetical protein P1P84_02845 [Deferrisomatales bacterium]|nr:hypothetical protein [Deferrisomatales bacterium]
MQRYTVEGTHWALHTTGLHDALSVAGEAAAVSPADVTLHSRELSEWTEFFASPTFEDAAELAQNGWPEGRREMAERFDTLQIAQTAEDTGAYSWETEGSFFDLGQLLSGEPEHWLHEEREPRRRVWQITVNVAASNKVTQATIMNRGAAVLALVDALQGAGDIVELHVVASARDWSKSIGRNILTTIPLGVTPLDMGTAAYALAHPSMLRRIILGCMEYASPGKVKSAYGKPCDPEGPEYRDDLGAGKIYLGALTSKDQHFPTPEAAAGWLNAKVSAINAL